MFSNIGTFISMQQIHAIPYKKFEIRIYKTGMDYLFQIYKEGTQLNGFTFTVTEIELNDYFSMGSPPVESFEEFIQACREYIDTNH